MSEQKSFRTFDDFHPFYLSEHGNRTSRGLHFAGTEHRGRAARGGGLHAQVVAHRCGPAPRPRGDSPACVGPIPRLSDTRPHRFLVEFVRRNARTPDGVAGSRKKDWDETGAIDNKGTYAKFTGLAIRCGLRSHDACADDRGNADGGARARRLRRRVGSRRADERRHHLAPTIPSGLHATVVTDKQVALVWAPSTDLPNPGGTGVAGYRVYRNGTTNLIATVNATSYTDTGLIANTGYTYQVSAVDQAVPTPNESPPSQPLVVTTQVPADTSAPTVPSGVKAGAVTSNSVTLTWSASTDLPNPGAPESAATTSTETV